MKNIHLIPTDKPSRLLKTIPRGNLILSKSITSGSHWGNLHIYITNDEEIKMDDWYLDDTNSVRQAITECESYWTHRKKYQKIILTTDQNLIKDGVQPIDDEFLEWFVKNPSCEYVEVKKESEFYRSGPLDLLGHSIITYKINIPEKITRCCGKCNGVDDLCYSDMTCDNHKERGCEICYGKRIEYKIIIPKEELNLNCFDCDKSLEDCTCIEDTIDMKETLEEAAEKYADFSNDYVPLAFGSKFNETTKRDFIEGAKWQQERMYTEEEILDILRKNHSIEKKSKMDSWITNWFEQFKKK